MLIRHKFLLATAVPVLLLIVQVFLVSIFIRELQAAVQFIGAAQDTIEADLRAQDRIDELRGLIKQVPQTYVQKTPQPTFIKPLWQKLNSDINLISTSQVISSFSSDVINSVQTKYEIAEEEINLLLNVLATPAQDMDALLIRAIESDRALDVLNKTLEDLALELRYQLQQSVDREKEIHNRPIIAGVIVGAIAVGLLILLVWLFVERGIVRRLSTLSKSMLAIANGDLHASIPSHPTTDEIGQMTEALGTFRNTAVEVKKQRHLEAQQKRQQRQFWLEHMASFLRHEVKNKQVGAEQSIRLLLNKENHNLNVSKYCDRAATSLVEMRALINSTVDAADIESALNTEAFDRLDIREVVTEYVENNDKHENSQILFIDELRAACMIKGDRHRLVQMLDKLVSNAMDFKHEGTDVCIRLRGNRYTQIVIRVENKGLPLPIDTQKIFGLSFSRREGPSKKPENVGFGLFVARRIAEYHFGTIEATNSDSGVVFSIYLPVLAEQ